jgi:hypothetical protein
MKYIKLQYENGNIILDSANTLIELIRKYDLASKDNSDIKIYELDRESFVIQSLELELSTSTV